jgi:hypothetical protein
VQRCQLSPCLAERPEVADIVNQRQAGQHLFEVGGKGLAVLRAVQEAVNVVENVFFGKPPFAPKVGNAVLLLSSLQNEIADGVATDIFVFVCCFK